ncbi:MAG: YitT family protein [Clostridia bacterium]|nr:YitT family protein [Clostridia bacterium]
MKKTRIVLDLIITLFASVLSAVALYCFVETANFAPSGVDGIAMMTQELTGINIGYVSLAINIPLLICAWFFINKKYVAYTTIFTVISSVAMILMEKFTVYQYISPTNAWVAVFASGIMMGLRTAIMIKIGGSTGGVDIIASIVQKKKPYLNIESLISIFCYIIIGFSFFVYGNVESVVMSVAQMMIFNVAMNSVLKTTRNAVEVRIITSSPDDFKQDILLNLKHGATIIPCEGMFTGDQKKMLVTIINIRQMDDLIKLSRKYPNSFIYFSEVNGVWGNFRWNKTDAVK